MIDCCRIFDGTISVRWDGAEICRLPDKEHCTPEDLEIAFDIVAETMAQNRDEVIWMPDSW